MCRNIAYLTNQHDTLFDMRIGLVGGGTGGHFYPLIAVAEALNKNEVKPELFYFGPSPYDKPELEKNGITYISCPAGKYRLYFSIQNILDIFRNFIGVFVAIVKLYDVYPDVIFSKGGYTSVPILIAAKILLIPVVIHESDSVPGRANKRAAKQARYIGIAYDDVASYFKAEKTALVGIPLRSQYKNLPQNPFEQLGIPRDKPLIFVTGGSQGADRINKLMLRSIEKLLPHYRIFHQTGTLNIHDYTLAVKSLLQDSPLLSDYYLADKVDVRTMSALMSAASLVITRAGSTTIFEVAYAGKPSIVIPIPEDVSRDQRKNAYAYARSGAAVVIEEHNMTPNLLEKEIKTIIDDPDRQRVMGAAARGFYIEGAEEKIANILVSIGIEHES